MIKLIVSDMDGTLLNDEKSISPATLEAIRLAKENGIDFMVATGRNLFEANDTLVNAGIECAKITGNGSRLYDENNEEVYSCGIPLELAFQILEVAEQNDVFIEIAMVEGVISDNPARHEHEFKAYLNVKYPHLTDADFDTMMVMLRKVFPVREVTSYEDEIRKNPHDVLNFIFIDGSHPEKLVTLKSEVEKIGNLKAVSSDFNNLEVTHISAGKGEGVKKIAEIRGLGFDEIATIGDNFNDIEMLQEVQYSFAMGQASDEVKSHAMFVTKSNADDGVAEAIQKIIELNQRD
ncbi:MAG: HAD family hydrolase [Lactobacillales bacterium]|jgi:Cof subfamily protein (haloacid dehalogenase superfamily)|nr:HAD family hydrolase [Lactobacillales bacterium]